MTTKFETVKVGDKVWCIMSGWGEVREIKSWKDYPIVVYFADDEFKTYTVDGLYEADNLNQTLFWDEIVIDAPLKPLHKLEVDTKVVVWQDDGSKYRRHFSHFGEDGVLHAFVGGLTSFSGKGSTTAWDSWELSE